eukprot:CAMPEP_0170146306 /NCGR_PEP_ID=MMETSP0033_2-20121228/29512_1 /TAXON_ID=195969 /ORGANISM="Dolichomastix tenuilepis, Strain CCMP3274" /LENGTH=53 /DNA_ID=CAMNT_0010383017 /DNA_START=367 /DNA_END=525 /DNA_ORIENTATION=-
MSSGGTSSSTLSGLSCGAAEALDPHEAAPSSAPFFCPSASARVSTAMSLTTFS